MTAIAGRWKGSDRCTGGPFGRRRTADSPPARESVERARETPPRRPPPSSTHAFGDFSRHIGESRQVTGEMRDIAQQELNEVSGIESRINDLETTFESFAEDFQVLEQTSETLTHRSEEIARTVSALRADTYQHAAERALSAATRELGVLRASCERSPIDCARVCPRRSSAMGDDSSPAPEPTERATPQRIYRSSARRRPANLITTFASPRTNASTMTR